VNIFARHRPLGVIDQGGDCHFGEAQIVPMLAKLWKGHQQISTDPTDDVDVERIQQAVLRVAVQLDRIPEVKLESSPENDRDRHRLKQRRSQRFCQRNVMTVHL
jgi:hypothetical protein